MPGSLYVVSLPIGHLSDITLRAIDTLRSVDAIVAEDTRTTQRVLQRYEIQTPFYSSLYEGGEDSRVNDIVSRLVEGRNLALVSDAGTPLVSDPGYPLVRAAIAAGVAVTAIPGPSALLCAVVASGLPADRFIFEGSLPRKRGHRRDLFAALQREPRTVIAYESPHRLLETLDLLATILPERRMVVARELTKLHEEFLRGRPAEVLQGLAARGDVRGEAVLVIEGCSDGAAPASDEALAACLNILRQDGVPKRTQERLLVALGVPKNRAYQEAHVPPD